MFPLSQAEKQGEPYRASFYPSFEGKAPAVWEAKETKGNIVLGGYPELQFISAENKADWFGSYISTYLLGDIRNSEESVDIDINDFYRLLRVLAARTAEPINYTSIADESGISAYKVRILVSLLISYGIIYLLSPYSSNTLKSIVKTPRMHFTDTGLCCHLLGIEDVDGFLKHPLAGRIVNLFSPPYSA